MYFNSIKVRLEQMKRAEALRAEIFQFHKGTIRTAEPSTTALTVASFQFHKGTIRTSPCKITARRALISIP